VTRPSHDVDAMAPAASAQTHSPAGDFLPGGSSPAAPVDFPAAYPRPDERLAISTTAVAIDDETDREEVATVDSGTFSLHASGGTGGPDEAPDKAVTTEIDPSTAKRQASDTVADVDDDTVRVFDADDATATTVDDTVFGLHPALATSSTDEIKKAVSRIVLAKGRAIACLVAEESPNAALVTAALHTALAAGVKCPARHTRTPAVLIAAATDEAATQVHKTATAVLKKIGDAAAQMPYKPTAALLLQASALQGAAAQIIRDGGVSPVVVGTFTRLNALIAQQTVQPSKAVCVMLIGAHKLPAPTELTRLLESLPREAQVVAACPPLAWANLETLFHEAAPDRGRLENVWHPHSEAAETGSSSHDPPRAFIPAHAANTQSISECEEESHVFLPF
jgi:hypothetical protein